MMYHLACINCIMLLRKLQYGWQMFNFLTALFQVFHKTHLQDKKTLYSHQIQGVST